MDEVFYEDANRRDLEDFEVWLDRLERETCQEDIRFLEWLEYKEQRSEIR